MRICYAIESGEPIEMQSAATEGTLIRNALAMGWSAGDIVERAATEDEWRDLCDQWNARQPGAVPGAVTFRQFVLALLETGWIDDDEAEAWAARRAIPAFIETAIGRLSGRRRQAQARVTVLGMADVERDHPMIRLLAAGTAASDGDIDAVFRQAATL